MSGIARSGIARCTCTRESNSFIKNSYLHKNFQVSKTSIGVTNAFDRALCEISEEINCISSINGFDIPSLCFNVIPESQNLSYNGILGLDVLKRFKLNFEFPAPLRLNKLIQALIKHLKVNLEDQNESYSCFDYQDDFLCIVTERNHNSAL